MVNSKRTVGWKTLFLIHTVWFNNSYWPRRTHLHTYDHVILVWNRITLLDLCNLRWLIQHPLLMTTHSPCWQKCWKHEWFKFLRVHLQMQIEWPSFVSCAAQWCNSWHITHTVDVVYTMSVLDKGLPVKKRTNIMCVYLCEK